MPSLRARAVVLLMLLSGCPKGGGKGTGFTIPRSEDPAAQRKFSDARARFEDGDFSGAGKEFEAFLKAYPNDPLAETAKLFAGRAAYEVEDFAAAEAHLRAIAGPGQGLRRKARYFLGLVEVERGAWARGRTLLEPIAADLDQDGGEQPAAIAAALAQATWEMGDAAAALGWLGKWWPEAGAAERAHALERATAAVAKLADGEVGRVYRGLDKHSGVAAVVAVRWAALLSAQGDGEGAAAVLADTAAAREEAGLAPVGGAQPAAAGPGDPRVIGALLGQSGSTRQVGERVLRGLGLALGLAAAPGGTARSGYALVARDPGDDAAARVDELVAEGAVAIVGPVDKKAAAVAARRAAELGVPLLPMTGFAADVPAELGGVFRVVVSAEARARALAERAAAEGAQRVAVIAPDSAYGKKVGDAFVAEARARGLDVAGPLSPDTVFLRAAQGEFDGVLALYHDQAFIPLKLHAPRAGLTVLLRLPYLRVSPAHGTAFDLAGTGRADAENLRFALECAARWAPRYRSAPSRA